LRGSFGKKRWLQFRDEYIDDGWLLGPVQRIRQRVRPWFDCGLSGLIVRYGPQLTHDRNAENLDVFAAKAERPVKGLPAWHCGAGCVLTGKLPAREFAIAKKWPELIQPV
jgi:hypothetical protein